MRFIILGPDNITCAESNNIIPPQASKKADVYFSQAVQKEAIPSFVVTMSCHIHSSSSSRLRASKPRTYILTRYHVKAQLQHHMDPS